MHQWVSHPFAICQLLNNDKTRKFAVLTGGWQKTRQIMFGISDKQVHVVNSTGEYRIRIDESRVSFVERNLKRTSSHSGGRGNEQLTNFGKMEHNKRPIERTTWCVLCEDLSN